MMRDQIHRAGRILPALAIVLLASTAHEPAHAAAVSARGEPTPPSRFGVLTSRRWAYGTPYVRESLTPVPNPNPSPEPQPRRDHPFDVAVSGDGTKVYVGLQGSELEPGHEVAVFDVRRDKVIGRIPLKSTTQQGPSGLSPYRLTLHPDGRFIFVTNRFSNFASVIDTQTDQVVSEIPLDFYCQGMTFDRNGRNAYVTNRYLDQVFVVDVRSENGRFLATMQELGGLDDKAYLGDGATPGIHDILVRNCGAAGCHRDSSPKNKAAPDDFLFMNPALPRRMFVTGPDPLYSFLSAIPHIRPGNSAESRLLQAVVGTHDGGYGDLEPRFEAHPGGVVFKDPARNPDYRAIVDWVDSSGEGPGIPVGNPRSKPKVCALTTDGRYLFVGNTGTQDVSIVDVQLGCEVAGIYIQNVVNDLTIHHSSDTGHDYLLVTTEGIGFGVGREWDPYGGETWDPSNPAAQFSVWRDVETARVYPRRQQEVLGPFDAVDGTSEIKFRDIQNDVLLVDINALDIPKVPPTDGLPYVLLANRYESHRHWVRYTSDTAESTYGDIKGDIPPDLMRVVGAFPEKVVVVGDRVFVTMQGSNQVQEWRFNLTAPDPSDYLMPVAVYPTGMQPIGIAAGPSGTSAEGKLFVANFLGGSISVIDTVRGQSHDVIIDPSVRRLPVPATNAERGEIMAHTSLFSSDGDTSCFHCHYLDVGDGRPWGVSQVVGQEYLSDDAEEGHLVIGGTMTLPQMRGLFAIQPFFLEGAISAFEPRSMIMEHAPADDFLAPNPHGDYTGIEGHVLLTGTADVQSGMDASTQSQATPEERRDVMFQEQTMRLFGKAFRLRDFQRFVGEWQIHEPRLLPNPFDQTNESVLRGQKLFEDAQIGCVSCHPAPHFAKKDFPDTRQQAMMPQVMFTPRDGAFTLISMNRLDYINGYRRDLEPWDIGRAEETQGHFTAFPLRGIWDRPPSFLHNGMARTLREVVAAPGHAALRTLKYEPLIGGYPERPGRKEVGFNMTDLFTKRAPQVNPLIDAGGRIGFDTHGGTSHLSGQQVDDLVNFMNSIE